MSLLVFCAVIKEMAVARCTRWRVWV